MYDFEAYRHPSSAIGLVWLAEQAERKPVTLIDSLKTAQSGEYAVSGVEYTYDMAPLNMIGAVVVPYLESKLRKIVLEYAKKRADGWDGGYESGRPENRLFKYIADNHSVLLDSESAQRLSTAVHSIFRPDWITPWMVIEYFVEYVNRNLRGHVFTDCGLIAAIHGDLNRNEPLNVVVTFAPLPEPRD